ncbi:major facilitator superfamily domain-containing protein [Lipomyces tetrasporus]|uniref:Major facilitator superfamily domain-containing protein n=1 Tax=Lipomyces tetrasporus TaxID=54092 RepID=A0AAD7VUU9_9ASCO|nr:major facilitator superfamily domain-containing protein [Lipomyces tetrasporus]KAJ8101620.1 major facilitator superfamily domain-containing protein [Lipomyces tetrasporus]
MDEFHCSEEVAMLGLTSFVCGLGLGPALLAPLSEFYGRRPIYISSLAFFFIWLIPSAVARNIETMIIARFFNGLSGSAFLSVAGGTVGDLFRRHELHTPMMVYSASPFIGPVLGPAVGGFINQFTNWRWTFYTLMIWSGILLTSFIFTVPETYHPVLLRKKAVRLRKETGNENLKAPIENITRSVLGTVLVSLIRPFELLYSELMVLNLCLFSALLMGILYLFFGAFGVVFEGTYHFQLWQVGLTFFGIFVGMVAAIGLDPIFHRNYYRLVQRREAEGGEPGGSEPEFRLPPAIVGAVLVPIGLFWFGWTSYRWVYWIVPVLGSVIFGMGEVLLFGGIFTFLVDAYPHYAASALAANSFVRSCFGATFPLFGNQMYEKLGYQWASSLLAFLSLLMMPFPYIFYKYGKRIRVNSKYAKS